MKCPKCGTDNKDGAKFCKGCGEQLSIISSPDSNVSESKSNKNTLIICVTAIICVLIIASAFVLLNSGTNSETVANDVNLTNTSNDTVNDTSDDSSQDTAVAENTVDSMTYGEASTYLSGASSTVIQNTFDEADKNGDGLLTGSEISKFKKLADLTERTADTSNSEHVEAQDYGAGDGTTRTRYCTTHGRVATGEDNLCPYCQQEGLDARTVKDSTEYI